MPTTKVTPRAKHPNKTKQFLDATQIALEMFDVEISSFTDEVKEKAYKHYIRSYREALVPVWNIARFANIDTVLKTVTDKKMQELKTMAERLKTTPPRPKAISDKTSIPDLETVTSTMLQQFPGEKLPTASTCEIIGNVFASLSTARTAYSEATQGLAQLATLLTPEAVHSSPCSDCYPMYTINSSRSTYIAIIHTAAPSTKIADSHRTRRNYKLYKKQDPSQPRS